jgi:hypothetical protein
MPTKLPTAYTVAMVALAMGKQDLTSVVISLHKPVPSEAAFLACRFVTAHARHRFARFWARRTRREVFVDDWSELVFVPVAPLLDGRSEAIGRLVPNPGNGRAFESFLRAAGLG